MKNLKQLCLFLSAGTIAALSISACGDDTPIPSGSAGMNTTAGTGTAGTGTAGTGTAGTGTAGTGTAGTSAGTASGGTGTAGTASGGGGAGGGSGGKGGAGGSGGGSGGASGGSGGASGGSGGSGGASAGPTCPDIDGESTDSATCTTYCADAVPTCGANASSAGKVADMDKCMTFCKTFTQTQLCCRAYHAQNAKTAMPDLHCKHTIGVESCQ